MTSEIVTPLVFDILIRDVTAVLGGASDDYRMVPATSIGITGNEISWISEGARPPDGIRSRREIDGADLICFPGLINTHNHLFQTLCKGLGDEQYLIPWVEVLILPTAEGMSVEETYLGAMLGCLEGLRSGTTTVLDFMFGLPTIEHHRAVLKAFRDTGIRGFLGRATRELNPDSGGRDPWYLPLEEVFAQMRELAREYPSSLPRARVMPAPGTVRTMTAAGLVRVAEYATAEDSQLTIHMGEYTEERALAIERWGIGAFAKAEELGLLGPRCIAAHCVKLDDNEVSILARTGTHVSYNPTSNMYLGNGIPPIVELLKAGVNVSLATDGAASNNSQDMIEALKFGALNVKGQMQDPRAIGSRDLLRMATVGGAAALGVPEELGAIEVGRRADLFLFDPFHLKSVPMHDPISTLVYSAGEQNVHTVVVDGEVVIDAGRLTRVDEVAFVREVHDRALALARRVGTARLAIGRRMQPYGIES